MYADGRFAMPDGKAHFSVVRPLHANDGSWFDEPVPSDSSFDQLRMSGVEGLTLSGKENARPEPVEGRALLRVSTRRGKQFNSMIQRDVDPLTGAHRDEISPDDLHPLLLAFAIDPDSMEPDYNATVELERTT